MSDQDFSQSSVVILRRIYLDIVSLHCEENSKSSKYCAAKLISYFDHWRKWKTKMLSDEWIYMPLRQIYDDLMGEHSLHVLRESIEMLQSMGILSRRNSPNGQDKTYQYRINLDVLQQLLPDSDIDVSINSVEAFDKLASTHTEQEAQRLRDLSYDAFLASDYWKTVRKYVISTRKQCQSCESSKNLQVHHKNYSNRGNEHNHLKDLQLLCKHCHLEAHKFVDA